jgi:hypothetical protein
MPTSPHAADETGAGSTSAAGTETAGDVTMDGITQYMHTIQAADAGKTLYFTCSYLPIDSYNHCRLGQTVVVAVDGVLEADSLKVDSEPDGSVTGWGQDADPTGQPYGTRFWQGIGVARG